MPYRNSPQSIADVAAGHVAMAFAEAGASLPLIRDGKLRALAVTSSTRLPTVPELPPFGEAVGAPDFEAVSWHVLLAPAGTPPDVVAKLHAEMKRIMEAPDMRKKVADIGLIPLDIASVESQPRLHQGRRREVGQRWSASSGWKARSETSRPLTAGRIAPIPPHWGRIRTPWPNRNRRKRQTPCPAALSRHARRSRTRRASPARSRDALAAADVAAVLLRLKPAGERDLINRVKALAPRRAADTAPRCCSTAMPTSRPAPAPTARI